MNKSTENHKIKIERIIPAHQGEVFDAWLNPKIPGTPWYEGEKVILNPKVDGLFYWLIKGHPHYGRFIEIERPDRIQHSWMSRNTLGEESTVTITFQKKGEDTLMTLVHSGLPSPEEAKAHEQGWTYFLDKLVDHFGSEVRQK